MIRKLNMYEGVNDTWIADELRNCEGIQKGDEFIGLAYVRDGRSGDVGIPFNPDC